MSDTLTHSLADKLKDVVPSPTKTASEKKAELQAKYKALLEKMAAHGIPVEGGVEAEKDEDEGEVGLWTIKSAD